MGAVAAVPIVAGLSLLSLRPTDIVTFFKWLYSYCYITACRTLTKDRFDNYDENALHDPVKNAFLVPQAEKDAESPQPESHLLHAADEIFFYGVNSSSEYVIVRLARSVNGEAEAWIFLKLKDGKVYKLNKTSGYQSSSSGEEFTCEGLKMHYNAPMRRWRIFYNGLLREASEDPHSGKAVYVKLALLWCASSDLFDMTRDINAAALALAFAKSKWQSFRPPLEKLNDTLNIYAQSGVLHGTVNVDGEPAERHLYLFGERIRFLGDTCLKNGVEFTHILGQIPKNGSIMHISQVSIPGIVKNLRFGFVVLPNGELETLSDFEPQFDIRSAAENEDITAFFHCKEAGFKICGKVGGRLSHFESNKGWDGSLNMDCMDIEMNGARGSGVLIKGKIMKPSIRSTLESVSLRKIPKDIPLAVHFSEDVCEISDVTGGKGSSLGKLSHLSSQRKTFLVPDGVVVTTSAYKLFENEHIKKKIRYLEAVLYGNTSGDVKEACQGVMDEVIKTDVPDAVRQAVVQRLEKSFGEQIHTKKFAVRSSATGEDTEQMSAAGQMETFLGVTGLSEIIYSIKKCWASQFGFTAVQYKRQNGQIINTPMAVVVQEMIPCDVAGVLFTCDPLTGNPTLMSITANYGLGESVVSASEEPDTLVLGRDEEDNLQVKDKIIGAKSHRIVIKEDEGTRLEEVSETEKKSCCLSDSMALRLGNIAVQIEKSYRSKRDIEWGFWNNNLYIFQSRPVTSGTGETDYEIDHERDTIMRIENEYFTVSNVGEVMPGAMSDLGSDVLYKIFALAFRTNPIISWPKEIPRYFQKTFGYLYRHAMFYVIDLLEQINEGKEVADASMLGFFGRVLEDPELYEAAKERFPKVKQPILDFIKKLKLLRVLFGIGSFVKKSQEQYANYHVAVEKMQNSKDVYEALMYACSDSSEAVVSHSLASRSSAIWNLIIINLLGKARGGVTPEVYRDFAKLLASISDVESADVPCAMQNLAFYISKEIKPEDFKKKDTEEILQWLKTSPTEAGRKFQDFLCTHGHRCLKEFDIRSATWGENPKLLIQLLQNLVGTVSESSSLNSTDNPDEVLNSLDLNLKFLDRLLLKYLFLPQCRKAVQYRETTKSLLIKQIDHWRKGYKHLAKLMVSEGRIPDADLFFFMTLEELQQLLSSRSPNIISRASHRRRRQQILDRYIFPEISKGFPKPINDDNTPVVLNEDYFKMQGIPVSQGVAKGFVRVAITLEEASHLKAGEILLTYSTDIGWTPYFPSLAGVVTELGGLISHGAVVSREYGLPCIAGLHGATRQFQTGDYVLLDGNRGILQKLPPPE